MRRALELSLPDWLALVEAWLSLPFYHLALRVTSYDRLDSSVRADETSARSESRALAEAEKLHRLVRYAVRLHLLPMTCLVRSLVLQKILRKRNVPARVKIGAQKTQGLLYAHAWVEVDGQPVGEAPDLTEKFNVLRRGPESPWLPKSL